MRRAFSLRLLTPAAIIGAGALAFATTALRANAQAVPDTLPPILLVHGIWSSASTWDWLTGQLASDGFRVFRTSTNTSAYITNQSQAVKDYVNGTGVSQDSPIIVAHSMGGIISRTLVTTMPADALITIGSPHHGHVNLNDAAGNPYLYGIAAALGANAGAAYQYLQSYCGQTRDDGYGQSVAPCYTLSDFLDWTGVVLGVAYAINTFLTGSASIDDMRPSSPFIADLNSSGHVANEQATTRIALIAQLNPWERDNSIFRLFYDEADADYLGSYLGWFAFTVKVDGLEIIGEAEANSGDPWYWERLWGGIAVLAQGVNMELLPQNYNNLMGGWPNDGFMPIETQHYAGAFMLPVWGVSHTEETTSLALYQKTKEVALTFTRN